jgi:hypothetical protein
MPTPPMICVAKSSRSVRRWTAAVLLGALESWFTQRVAIEGGNANATGRDGFLASHLICEIAAPGCVSVDGTCKSIRIIER